MIGIKKKRMILIRESDSFSPVQMIGYRKEPEGASMNLLLR